MRAVLPSDWARCHARMNFVNLVRWLRYSKVNLLSPSNTKALSRRKGRAGSPLRADGCSAFAMLATSGIIKFDV
jgi:hypothetical protein